MEDRILYGLVINRLGELITLAVLFRVQEQKIR